MRKLAIGILALLSGCQPCRGPSADWDSLVHGAEGLSAEALADERDRAIDAYASTPTDATRLRLAYLLSRPDTTAQDLAASQALLDEIQPGSPYGPVRDLLRREISLVAQLEASRRVADLQASRLQWTEAELGQYSLATGELARAEEEIRSLRASLAEAQRQLAALKSIDSDLAEPEKPLPGESP